jgi:dTDP-4-amino-4,6-dideoxygalactose transaminase
MGGSEQEFVARAFESNYIAPVGPMVDAFEREFTDKTGIPHAVAVASGTAAMHLALKLIGVGPGDEVFGSTLTFIGSISPAVFLGARPVFIDCDRTTWCMDPELLAAELERCAGLGKLPKAVVSTDLYGQCADYDRIRGACGRYGVPVVVDAAEAMGASYNGRSAGAGAAAAVYSFNGNKIITTSGGGMLAAEDRELIEKARFLSQQARDPFPHYEHSEIGFNYRMSNIVAAIGLGQLEVLEERVQAKRRIFRHYQERLKAVPGIEFMPEAPYGRANRWLTVVLITPEIFGADREALRLALEAENIESRPVWKPMHLQPVFQAAAEVATHSAGYLAAALPNGTLAAAQTGVESRAVGGAVAEDLFARGLCLPSGTAMTEADIDRVVSVLLASRGGHRQ